MFFYVSKLFWFFASPSNLALMVAMVGIVLLFKRGVGYGRMIVVAGVSGLAVLAFTPIGPLLIRPLEDRFPPSTGMAPVAGIIVLLGGATVVRGHVEVGARGSAALRLAAEQPRAKLVLSGGVAGVLGPAEQTEARAAASFFRAAGISDNRIILEERSRNTRENALFVREFVSPGSRERLLLVTSAYHMPRAVGAFRAAGVEVEAYPVDFRTEGRPSDYVRFASGGTLADLAVKEWLGLIAYRVAGYTTELFPAPR
jgi:uncharacterized SAM-binding protein YcdF (DUF218 family)